MQVTKKWRLGHSRHELLESWGIPFKQSDDGAGGRIMMYCKYRTSGYGTTYTYKIFYVSAEDKIYRWRIERNHTPPARIDLYIYR